jgi:hypothetical protein
MYAQFKKTKKQVEDIRCSECGRKRYTSKPCPSAFHLSKQLVRRGTGSSSQSVKSSSSNGRGGESSGRTGMVEPVKVSRPVRKDLERYEKNLGIGVFSLSSISESIETISNIPNVKQKPMMYFITLPSGSGKTWLSEKYGFIDIDSCMGRFDRSYLAQAISFAADVTDETKKRSQEWLSCVRQVFRAMLIDRPTLVLVHDDVTGFVTGGRKIGAANVALGEKIRGNKSMDAARRKLIELNHAVYNKFEDGANEFKTHLECEEFVLARARALGVMHSGDECQSKVGKAGADDMSHIQLVNAFAAGRVTKEYVDKRAFEDREISKSGFGLSMNTWAMALAGAFYSSNRKHEMGLRVSMESIKANLNLSGHVDLNKISALRIDEDDKACRLSWWLGCGRKLEKSEKLFEFVCGVGRNSVEVFKSVGMLLSKSRFLCGVELCDADRMGVLALARLYGYRGEVELYDQLSMEEADEEDRVLRHAKAEGNVYLPKSRTPFLAGVMDLEVVPDRFTVGDVCRHLDDWTTRDVMCLFEMMKQWDENVWVGDGPVAQNVALAMLDQYIENVRSVPLNWRFEEMMMGSARDYPGIGSVVMEKGMKYILNQGRQRRMRIMSTVLEDIILNGRDSDLANEGEKALVCALE